MKTRLAACSSRILILTAVLHHSPHVFFSCFRLLSSWVSCLGPFPCFCFKHALLILLTLFSCLSPIYQPWFYPALLSLSWFFIFSSFSISQFYIILFLMLFLPFSTLNLYLGVFLFYIFCIFFPGIFFSLSKSTI